MGVDDDVVVSARADVVDLRLLQLTRCNHASMHDFGVYAGPGDTLL